MRDALSRSKLTGRPGLAVEQLSLGRQGLHRTLIAVNRKKAEMVLALEYLRVGVVPRPGTFG